MIKKKYNNIINPKVTSLMSLMIITTLISKYFIYPGLTDDNVILNVVSMLVMVLILLFMYFYIKRIFFVEKDEFKRFYLNNLKEPETELDYTPIVKKIEEKQIKHSSEGFLL
jgi:hypothetical protein